MAAGYAGIRAILSVSPGNIPRIGLQGANVGLDWRVLGFTPCGGTLNGASSKPALPDAGYQQGKFTLDDKEVEFSTKIGDTTIQYKFQLKDMVFRGNLEL